MKILIAIVIILITLIAFYLKRNRPSIGSSEVETIDFVSLESITSSEKHLPLISQKWLEETLQKWNDNQLPDSEKEHYKLSEKICNVVYQSTKYWEKNQTHAEFLNELTPEQRLYFTLINFESQVNNGGVYQFLFNYPDLSTIALVAMRKMGMDQLASDYNTTLNEYFGKFETIQQLYDKFQDSKYDWEKRYTAFAEGYKELTSAEVIERYFYEDEFKKSFHVKMANFVKENQNKLVRTN